MSRIPSTQKIYSASEVDEIFTSFMDKTHKTIFDSNQSISAQMSVLQNSLLKIKGEMDAIFVRQDEILAIAKQALQTSLDAKNKP